MILQTCNCTMHNRKRNKVQSNFQKTSKMPLSPFLCLFREIFSPGTAGNQRRCCTSSCCHRWRHGAVAATLGRPGTVGGQRDCWPSRGPEHRRWRTRTPSPLHCAWGWYIGVRWWPASGCGRWRRKRRQRDRWSGRWSCRTCCRGWCAAGQKRLVGPECQGRSLPCERQRRPRGVGWAGTCVRASECAGPGAWWALPLVGWRVCHWFLSRGDTHPLGPGCSAERSHSNRLKRWGDTKTDHSVKNVTLMYYEPFLTS